MPGLPFLKFFTNPARFKGTEITSHVSAADGGIEWKDSHWRHEPSSVVPSKKLVLWLGAEFIGDAHTADNTQANPFRGPH